VVVSCGFDAGDLVAGWVDGRFVGGDLGGTQSQHTVPPQGVLAFRHDGKMVAGLFTYYNGEALEGYGAGQEHYLIENRRRENIIIHQPMGGETRLIIHPLSTWTTGSMLSITAYDASDRVIDELEQMGNSFTYRQRIDREDVAYSVRPAY